jgi:hypothetical protein
MLAGSRNQQGLTDAVEKGGCGRGKGLAVRLIWHGGGHVFRASAHAGLGLDADATN